jgi:uncharacterized membrane protein HdeD (DUF308 family)
VRWTRIVMGIVMVAAGGVWFLQGIGLLAGSFMSHSATWVVIGALVVLAGIVLLREAMGPRNGRGGSSAS